MNLADKIKNHQAVVSVIGLGYVGLPLAVALAKSGFQVVGIDTDINKVNAINNGRSYIQDVPSETVAYYALKPKPDSDSDSDSDSNSARASRNIRDMKDIEPRSGQFGQLAATSDYSILSRCDVVFICVPTPFDNYKMPDLSYIIKVSDQIANYLQADGLVILQSTTYPGTTEEVVRPILERSGLKAGIDFHLAFSPERIDPGNAQWTAENIPKVVGGLTETCSQVAALMLRQVNSQVSLVSSPRAAEMTKLLENIFRSVNIALINELALLCERIGLDIWEVIEAAATKPFGFMPFYPGPGVGGHCIPVDPLYLSWKAKEYDFHTRFIDLAAEINQRMPYYVVDLISRALSKRGKGLNEAKVLVVGVAFKPDVADTRNAPAERVIELLLAQGAEVNYHDPYVPYFEIHPNAFYKGHRLLQSLPIDDSLLASQDCVVILVKHRQVDYGHIVKASPLVIDSVNVTRGLALAEGAEGKVKYLGVGG